MKYVADLFCGAGGFSSGLKEAIAELGYDVNLVAVNHWDIAIATHSSNHPDTNHYCESLDGVDPRKMVPGGRLDLLLASPACTHHSNARGGKPMNDQERATAFHILRFVEALDIQDILVENVREFRKWGPLYPNNHKEEAKRGRPIKSREGEFFNHWIKWLRDFGYTVDFQILCAAHYGDATTRERLFIQARKGKRKLAWPIQTHGKPGDMFAPNDWRTAREVIDWSLKGVSIYGRKRPLSPNTLARIFTGLEKFGGIPFLLPHQHGNDGNGNVRSVDKPMGTITGTSCDMFLAQPYLVVMKGKSDASDAGRPVPTITSQPHLYLAEPCVVQVAHSGQQGIAAYSVGEPMKTLTGSEEYGVAESVVKPLVEPCVVQAAHGGHNNRAYAVDTPLNTVTVSNEFGVAEPVVSPFVVGAGGPTGSGNAQPVEFPLGTVLGENHRAVVQPYVVVERNNCDGKSVDSPVPTIAAGGKHIGVAQPCIVPVTHGGGPGRCQSVDEPLKTVTGAHRGEIGVVEPEIVVGPSLVKFHGSHAGRKDGDKRVSSVDKPMPTLDTQPRFGVVQAEVQSLELPGLEPSIVKYFTGSTAVSVDEPLPVITANYEHLALAEPEVMPMEEPIGDPVLLNTMFRYGPHIGTHPVDKPLSTITGKQDLSIAEPVLVKTCHGDKANGLDRSHDVNQPMPTICGTNNFAVADPYIVPFYGTSGAVSVDDPLDTVTSKDRFALVQPEFIAEILDKGDGWTVVGWLDIRFRMLQPHELSAAMSFPHDYHFAGNREQQVKQIGNAVAVKTGKALCQAVLETQVHVEAPEIPKAEAVSKRRVAKRFPKETNLVKPKINRVTITGADDNVDPKALAQLSSEFPFVEWGILKSASNHGIARFPSFPWIRRLKDSLGSLRNCAYHVCGRQAQGYMDGNRILSLDRMTEDVGRVQYNIRDRVEPIHPYALKMLQERQCIIQCAGPDQFKLVTKDALPGYAVNILCDASGGEGKTPVEWPIVPKTISTDGSCGYAGGLSPDNLAEQMPRIRDEAWVNYFKNPYWIDMESGVRTNDAFDLAKVRAVLEFMAPLIDVQ